MPFGMVSGVATGIHVLDGVHVPQKVEAILGIFQHLRPQWFEWAEWRIFCTEM